MRGSPGTRAAAATTMTDPPAGPLLDLGAGTGLWSDRLARWLAVPVIAVEPASAMLTVARRKRLRDVTLLQARAEALPLRDDACRSAWLSTVVHHVSDMSAAAAQIRRIVTAGGTVWVRNSFVDQPSCDVHPLLFFPSARRVAAAFPTMIEVIEVFAAAGLRLQHRFAPDEIVADTRTAFVHRLCRRADSLLQHIDDGEFDRGITHPPTHPPTHPRARAWASRQPSAPVVYAPDLLVFT